VISHDRGKENGFVTMTNGTYQWSTYDTHTVTVNEDSEPSHVTTEERKTGL
jgi:hypothetical protein